MSQKFNSQYLDRIYQEVVHLTDEQVSNREYLAEFVIDRVNRSYGNGRRHALAKAKAETV